MGTFLGKRIRKTTKLPLTFRREAEKMRVAIEKEIADGTYFDRHPTIGDIVDEVMQGKHNPTEIRTLKNLKPFRSMSLNNVDIVAINEYFTDLYKHHSPSTLKRYRNTINSVINYANRSRGYQIPRIYNPSVDDARDEHLDQEEVRKLLIVAKMQHFGDIYTTLTLTGVRLSELFRLNFSDYDKTNSAIFVKRPSISGKFKTNSRSIPIYYEPLKEILSRHSYGSIFDEVSSAILNKNLRSILRGIGVRRHVRVHDLRHTFAWLLAKSGADIGDIQPLLGHKDISQTMRYRGWVESRAKNNIKGMLSL